MIEVTPDYYSDRLYFTNTRVLKELFDKLELDNLQMIHQQQELESQYEDWVAKENKTRQNMQDMYNEQNKAKVELKSKITISQAILSQLKKKTTDGYIYETL